MARGADGVQDFAPETVLLDSSTGTEPAAAAEERPAEEAGGSAAIRATIRDMIPATIAAEILPRTKAFSALEFVGLKRRSAISAVASVRSPMVDE